MKGVGKKKGGGVSYILWTQNNYVIKETKI